MPPQEKEKKLSADDKKWLYDKLVFNGEKNFVQRLFKKDAPVLQIGDGSVATHQMGWTHTGPPDAPGTKIIVYPNIIFDKKKKGLMWLPPEEASRHAVKSGDFIEVGSAEEAELLSTKYKEVIPNFADRGVGGQGSQSYQLFEPQEEKDEKKRLERKLGLLPPEPKKTEKKKSGK